MDFSYHAENRIEMLKGRTARCICKYCGSPLELRRVIFHDIAEARVDIFCSECDRIEFGVEPEVYMSACNFVDNLEFDYYMNFDNNEKKRQMNIAKVCEIMIWCCKNIGILNHTGFTIPLNAVQNDRAECLVLSSEQIATAEEE
ncbi:MAG: hypothetical protein J6J05_05295 [Peptococcaceae bacterium]|nr:hypothetical protein [Peptococcaceae bacterium]